MGAVASGLGCGIVGEGAEGLDWPHGRKFPQKGTLLDFVRGIFIIDVG